jgi:segregation and condensation protein A
MTSPRLELEHYCGPLELLTSLIRRKEIAAAALEIRKILIQILEHLTKEEILHQGAESIEHAGLLLLLKSRALLPQIEEDEEETVICKFNAEILDHLLHYCLYREKAEQLSLFEERGVESFTRPEIAIDAPARPLGIEHLSLEQFSALFQQILRRAEANKEVIQDEEWTVKDKIRSLRMRMQKGDELPLNFALNEKMGKLELIVTFLAILEMMKLGELEIIKKDEQIFLRIG